uniref:Uncharacterized protein n=1 Tax=viral metagenome TaxID=1070528 RepID=A0A6C0KRM9_9ZZZZ
MSILSDLLQIPDDTQYITLNAINDIACCVINPLISIIHTVQYLPVENNEVAVQVEIATQMLSKSIDHIHSTVSAIEDAVRGGNTTGVVSFMYLFEELAKKNMNYLQLIQSFHMITSDVLVKLYIISLLATIYCK